MIQPGWDTIDMVKHDDQGRPAPKIGEGHLYSSKPPLLATLMAGEYWIIHKLTGTTLGEHPYAIGRFMLISLNVLPLAIYFWLLAGLAERFGTTDFGRIFMVACGCFATFLSTFVVVLTNHLPAAVSAGIALFAALRIIYDGERRVGYFALAGFFAAFTAANELPALSFFGLLSAWLLWKRLGQRLWRTCPQQPWCWWRAGNELPFARLAHSALCPSRSGQQLVRVPVFERRQSSRQLLDAPGSPQPHRPGRTIGRLVRLPRAPWASRHLFADAGVDSSCRRRDHAVCRTTGRPGRTWLVRSDCLRSVRDVLHLATARRPQLRRHDQRLSLGFLVRSAVAGGHVAGGRFSSSRRSLRLLACGLLCLSVLSVSYPTWNPWVQPWLADLLLELNWVQMGAR